MEFELLTLDGTKYSGTVAEVALSTANGQMAVLPHHEPFTAIAKPGSVVVHTGAKEPEVFVIFGGLIEVADNHVRMLADEADHVDELVREEIEAALAYAQQLKAAATQKHELHHAQTIIDRHEVRLGVIGLHHKKRHHP